MSEPYQQTILVEADRATADERHNSNNASWRNSLGTTINLEPGDKVSLYSSFLNIRGAESTNSVEFLGEKLSTNPEYGVKSFNHITKVKNLLLTLLILNYLMNNLPFKMLR